MTGFAPETEEKPLANAPDPVTEAQDAVEPSAPEAPASDAEAEARKYGWRPKEEFDYEPERWVDAERFLEMPATAVKRQRDEIREMKAEVDRQRSESAAEIDKIRKASLQAVKAAQDVAKADYEDKMASLDRAKREAVEAADTDAYNRADEQQKALKAPESAPTEETADSIGSDPAFKAALSNTTWHNDRYMMLQAQQLVDASPESASLRGADLVAFADKKLREYFPSKFPAAPVTPASRVDGGGLAPSTGRKKGFDALPSEAQAAGREFVESGVFKSLDDYAKAYFQENAS